MQQIQDKQMFAKQTTTNDLKRNVESPGSVGCKRAKLASKLMKTGWGAPPKPLTTNLSLKVTQVKHLLAFHMTPKYFHYSSYRHYRYKYHTNGHLIFLVVWLTPISLRVLYTLQSKSHLSNLTHLYIQLTLTTCLLCARQCPRCQRCKDGWDTSSPPREPTEEWAESYKDRRTFWLLWLQMK